MKCLYCRNSLYDSFYSNLTLEKHELLVIDDLVEYMPLDNKIMCGIVRGLDGDYIKSVTKLIIDAFKNEKDIAIFCSNMDYMSITDELTKILKNMNIRVHLYVLDDFKAVKNYRGFLRVIKNADFFHSICFCNQNNIIDYNDPIEEILLELELFAESVSVKINQMLDQASKLPEKSHLCELFIADISLCSYNKIELTEQEIIHSSLEEFGLYEYVPVKQGKEICSMLKTIRKNYAKKYKITKRKESCDYKEPCRGTCWSCEYDAKELFDRIHKENFVYSPDLSITAPIRGFERLRIDTDGRGVRTLVIFNDCYMECKYCLNRNYINIFPYFNEFNVFDLERFIHKDRIYFEMTSGGLTFGGGEPLYYPDFITEFHKTYPSIYLDVETSLNVECYIVLQLLDVVSCWHIDIKDLNPTIYYQYTNCSNEFVLKNLDILANSTVKDRVYLRVPHIPGFNTNEDVNKSIDQLRAMGFTHIEEFTYITN